MKFNVALLAILPLTLAAPVLEPKGPDTIDGGIGDTVKGATDAVGSILGGVTDTVGDLAGLTGGKRGISNPALSSANSNTNHIAEVDVSDFP